MKSYAEVRGHPPDFLVRYRLLRPEEGGRQATYQHLRCDMSYDELPGADIFGVHPEFLDDHGEPVENDVPVPRTGQATMWVLFPHMRPFHRERIRCGVLGKFREGPNAIGEFEVIDVLGLETNPDGGT